PTTKALVLARGLGTRMRRADPGARIDSTQQRVADAGVKGLMPVGSAQSRPFFDYIISALADAGITDVCLVIGPEHQHIRDYVAALELTRVRIHFAIQEEPLGTADAVLAGESFAAGESVLVVNSDNYYPVHTLRDLQQLGAAGVAAFEREALVRLGNVDAERVAKYAIIDIDERGFLKQIIEKPNAETLAALGPEVLVGMNSWSLPPEIYDACRRIEPSARGELELPNAVQYARDVLRVPFRVLAFRAGVIDLSSRADIDSVVTMLHDVEPRL
ncbi:MAG: sugar phosphate nucleotidyltransferase, partial [Longimicrobiales bacterium]